MSHPLKDVIEQIVRLPWKEMNPYVIAYASLGTGEEFAESLICAQEIFPDNNLLNQVIEGELWTDNLQFEHYASSGHHVHFLFDFFLTKGLFPQVSTKVADAVVVYLEYVRSLTKEQRAMTVFSREQELPVIFSAILKSHSWDGLGLSFYAHYLSKHIEWDSGENGHGDLIKDFDLDIDVLNKFYLQRLNFYQSLL